MRQGLISAILTLRNSVQKHYEIRVNVGLYGRGVREMSMSRSFTSVATEKPKRARSLMWYVDCLIVVGVLGVVAALVLINFVLV